MLIDCNESGQHVRVYYADTPEPETLDSGALDLVCDPTVELAEADSWWVLSCLVREPDSTRLDSLFGTVVLVERSALDQGTRESLKYSIIALARATTPAMRRSSIYVLSPCRRGCLGPAEIVEYRPATPTPHIGFALEPTRSGTSQPKAIIEVPDDADVGEVLANLWVFQLHRNGPACGTPEFTFDHLGRDADKIRHPRACTTFFPPVHTGDVIGVMARGIAIKPSAGTQATVTLSQGPDAWQMEAAVRQEDGFLCVEDDLELNQSGRLSRLMQMIATTYPTMTEEYVVTLARDWVRRRLDRIARATICLLDSAALRSSANAGLAEQSTGLGYLMYSVALPEELQARLESRKPLDEPWRQIKGSLDDEQLAKSFAAMVHLADLEEDSVAYEVLAQPTSILALTQVSTRARAIDVWNARSGPSKASGETAKN